MDRVELEGIEWPRQTFLFLDSNCWSRVWNGARAGAVFVMEHGARGKAILVC
jgi:hypothetical protein